MHSYPAYDSWNLELHPVLPKRTHFYHKQPLGVGTMLVESLTGYIARLAEAHDVSVAMLWNRELLPRIAVPAKNLSFIYKGHVLNGAGEYAQNCVTVLRDLARSEELNATTLMRFADVFSMQDCLRSQSAWCPHCFDDWRCSGAPVYEPLLWNINSVSHCPVHLHPLSMRCPHCGRAPYVLCARSRPGYCSGCLQWLGQRSARQQLQVIPDDAAVFTFAQSVGELLAAGDETCCFSNVFFKNNLRYCIGRLTDANVSRFCALTGMTYDSATHWLSPAGRIRLPLLINLCQQLRLSPLRFLTEPIRDKDLENAEQFFQGNTSHLKHGCRSRAWLDGQLASALSAEPAVSLHEVAAKLGYSSALSMRRRNPELCDRISDRYWRVTVRRPVRPLTDIPPNHSIQRAICTALRRNPRIPLKAVAQSLGFKNVVSLYKRFPDLCRAFAVANKQEKAERLASMRAVIEAALAETLPPTVPEVAARLGCTSKFVQYHFPELHTALIKRQPERKRFLDHQVIALMQEASREAPPPPISVVAARTAKSVHCLRVIDADLVKTIKKRHREQKALDAEQRRVAFRNQIAAAIADLRLRGISPSRKRVVAAISNPAMRNSHIVDQEITAHLPEREARPVTVAGGKC
jgi:TniQ